MIRTNGNYSKSNVKTERNAKTKRDIFDRGTNACSAVQWRAPPSSINSSQQALLRELVHCHEESSTIFLARDQNYTYRTYKMSMYNKLLVM